MYRVKDLYKEHGTALSLKIVESEECMKRSIRSQDVQRPGLALSGYLYGHTGRRIIVFGKVEMGYLRDMPKEMRIERLRAIFSMTVPAVIVSRNYRPTKEIVDLCSEYGIPLFRSKMMTMNLISKLTLLLNEAFAPNVSMHGTFVEVFGVGAIITGDSSVGKSETALGLLERGHRLVSDDVVIIKKREYSYLEGTGAELTRHHMEIRGIGIINVANLYGAVCIRESKRVDLVIKLEAWNDTKFYDRIGLSEKHCDILGVKVPHHTVPLKPGRDLVLLVETIVLNHRLKKVGYNSAEEFNTKLLEVIARKSKTGKAQHEEHLQSTR
ncbi:MAG: HPr kinase/phosphorylase [Waddliaceae bacterium]|jgi:HPr kinase/phosphorylase|nr:HPr kinase/phosphorylase [Waddliaceae bacterium]MBT3578719.1 HPr kinase/phosphorylase [Waddliaceae bacterium]MBT4444379.1 HPr kinase/phosphorylase [Waddliaceae bacterium]MBT6928294.1 HPr kinase/phosphorylase [Waddliaceae bacterium]MBT7264980.1 HPr kinase/phosphorylase [Waddliaceae bacterium]